MLERADPRIADYLTRSRAVEFPTTGGRDRLRPVLSAAQSRLRRPRRRAAAAARQVPWRPDLGGVEHAQPRHAVLDQPRHRGARRELRRQHRLRPRLSRAARRQLGHRRRRRLRERRALPRRARAGSTASAASSAAAAPAATRRSRRSTFRDFFQGGASYYGVSDLAALARDTHKFESRYLDWLIGPYPQEEARYRERSPIYHADRLSKPVIFFQGDEDAVVPPNQTEVMVEALRRKGNRGRLLPVRRRAARLPQGRQHQALPRCRALVLCDRGVPHRADVLINIEKFARSPPRQGRQAAHDPDHEAHGRAGPRSA